MDVENSFNEGNILTNNNQCLLCIALDDTIKNGSNSRIENRLLFSTDSFVVTPCISPLAPGHVLITSKKHYQNLSCMELNSIQEIKSILGFISNRLPEKYTDYLIAEHGSYDYEQNGGACIIHTHLHLIPDSKESLQSFDNVLKFVELNDIGEIKKMDFPYILAATKNIIKIYNAENVPSQMIRRVILASKGETKNWNWRLNTNQIYNELTLKMWQNVQK